MNKKYFVIALMILLFLIILWFIKRLLINIVGSDLDYSIMFVFIYPVLLVIVIMIWSVFPGKNSKAWKELDFKKESVDRPKSKSENISAHLFRTKTPIRSVVYTSDYRNRKIYLKERVMSEIVSLGFSDLQIYKYYIINIDGKKIFPPDYYGRLDSMLSYYQIKEIIDEYINKGKVDYKKYESML